MRSTALHAGAAEELVGAGVGASVGKAAVSVGDAVGSSVGNPAVGVGSGDKDGVAEQATRPMVRLETRSTAAARVRALPPRSAMQRGRIPVVAADRPRGR